MASNSLKIKIEWSTLFVFLSSLGIMAALMIATWDINFLPTDAAWFYLPAANVLPDLLYISHIHEVMRVSQWFHGKEFAIVNFSIAQVILNDHTTLRPLIAVCIVSLGLSSLLVFYIIGKYFGKRIGVICYCIFITTFWPYLYVLFIKHHIVGLFYFLLSVSFLAPSGKKQKSYIFYLASGIVLALAMHSSTVSPVYIPFYAAAWIYVSTLDNGMLNVPGRILKMGMISLAGFSLTVLYFNYPHVGANIGGYLKYLSTSTNQSHFLSNQAVLKQWISRPDLPVRGGFIWIIRYFLLVLPVLFPFTLLCLFTLIARGLRRYKGNVLSFMKTAGVIGLSLSPLLLIETKGVAQYGGNYFPCLVGMIFLIGYTLRVLTDQIWRKSLTFAFLIIFVLHATINFMIFFKDVYPARMATTFLSRELKDRGIKNLYVNKANPLTVVITERLNPELAEEITFEKVFFTQPTNKPKR